MKSSTGKQSLKEIPQTISVSSLMQFVNKHDSSEGLLTTRQKLRLKIRVGRMLSGEVK